MADRERGQQPVRDVGYRAGGRVRRRRRRAAGGGQEVLEVIGHTGDLCAQSPVIARKIRRSEEVRRLA